MRSSYRRSACTLIELLIELLLVTAITAPTLFPESLTYNTGDEYGIRTLGTLWAENHAENAYSSIGIPFNYNTRPTKYNRFTASTIGGAFSSNHATNCVGCVFLDGSVRFLDTNTADQVRLAIGTMRGGEVAGLP
jgi:hypothetical protein